MASPPLSARIPRRVRRGDVAAVPRPHRPRRSVRLWLQVLGDLIFHVPKEHWSTMKQDLRYAIRTLLRAPAFTVTVIATLALGIGANSVIFSAVDAVLLRDAPVSDPEPSSTSIRHPAVPFTHGRRILTISICGIVGRLRPCRPIPRRHLRSMRTVSRSRSLASS